MDPEWVTDIVFLSFFVYALTGVILVMLYLILHWRKMRLTLEYAAYFVGGLFSLIGGSMTMTLIPLQSSETFFGIFIFAQGVAIICLTYWKERKNKRKQRKLE
jgi:predicted membrane channel-forming protein YqfA (hemolysin III family)